MSKNIRLVSGAASLAVLLFLLVFKTNPVTTNHTLRLPGGEGETERADREAWERLRYADPVTGKIPDGIRFLERKFAANIPFAAAARGGGGAWSARGPWNVGGRTRALALDIINEDRILAGGVSGGVWLSEDAGQSWQRRTPLNLHPGCVSIAQDVRTGKTNNWYYLSGEVFGTSASGGSAFYLGDGLFKSTDNGVNWAPVSSTAGGNAASFTTLFQSGWRVVTDPVADTAQQVLLMATIGTIYRSTNGGTSWTAVRGGNISNYSYYSDIAVSSKGVFYAALSSEGPEKGLWRSVNGINWVNITPANFPAEYNRIVIGINPNDENEVWFLGNSPGTGHYNNYLGGDDWSCLWKYRYLSGNGAGANGLWENRTDNLPNSGTQFDRFAVQGGYNLVVKVQPGTNHVFIGGTCLYRSTDGFSSPNNTTQIGGYKIGTDLPFFEIYPNQHPDQHDLLFLPSNPRVLLSASDGGIFRTEDGLAPFVEWSSLNRGYLTTQFYTAIIEHTIPGDPTIIGGLQDNGNFYVNSTNPTAPWRQTVNGDGAYGYILDGKTGYILSIQQGKLVKCSINDQGTVTAFRRFDPIGPKKDDYEFINPFAVDPADQNILYQPAGRFLYRQNDLSSIALNGGFDSIPQGWEKYPDSAATGGNITAIAVSKNNPSHRLYFGTSNNRLYRIDNAHSGTPKFTVVNRPLVVNTGYIACLAVDPNNADRLLLTYSNYNIYSLYLSENGGQTWRRVAGNLEQNTVGSGNGPSLRWVSVLPLPGGGSKYFCATSVGLYSADTLITHTATQGTKWVLEAPELIGNTVVDFVDVRPVDGLVVAASHGNGMFSANFAASVRTKEPVHANYLRLWPNPTQGAINIQWPETASISALATFKLFNTQGRLVREWPIPNGPLQIDLEGLAPGTYLYQVGKYFGKIVRI